ncbi:hypothetical protein ACQKCH_01685 [Nubsella zeaxanthinifaciens]|uniref:hypothetical protein n=1 Tax=Nubsella zeaxanthinifaciens TaxID=392412 RepID=UPI003D00FEF9
MKLKLVFILHLICVQISLAQTVIIKGTVADSQNRKAISGVTIKVGSQATKTDRNGYFEINVLLKTVAELGINFSHIGYLGVNLIYQPQHVYQVYMTENSAELREVLIAPGDDIIKKAIKKIPENYPDKPTVIKGILRIQKLRNNSQYFRSDAVIKAYVPPYTGNEKTKVTVLANQLDTIYDKTLKYIRNIDSYNVVEFADVAHHKEILLKLLKKKKFDYRLVGKQMYNNRKVFVINSILQDTVEKYKKLETTLYIDTASYAFVAANLIYYNIPRIGPFIARKELAQRVVYENINGKWYLSEVHSKSIAEYKNEIPYSVTDFIRTDLDTNNVEKIPYKDIVQKMDDIFVIDKPIDQKDWSKYSAMFKAAEGNGTIEGVPTEKLDTIKRNSVAASINYKKSFGRKVYDYIRGDNNRFTYGIVKLPFDAGGASYDLSQSYFYGVEMSNTYRLYKDWFIGFEIISNMRKKIRIGTISLDAHYEFLINKAHRRIALTPHAGYQFVGVEYDGLEKINKTIKLGLRTSFELTHTKDISVFYAYSPNLKTYNISNLVLQPNRYSLGIALVFRK